MNGVVLLRAVADRESAADPAPLILDAPTVGALCQALEWRRSAGGRLTGIAVGPVSWEGAIREALALGLDGVAQIVTDEGQSHDVAWTAAALAASITPDTHVIFAGSAASDFGTGMLPAAVAGVLDWPLLADVVRATQVGGFLEAEVIAGPGKRRTYQTAVPAVLAGARLPPPPVYPPLARRLAAARASIDRRQPDEACLPSSERSIFIGYGPGRPRTKHLLRPSSAARPGDRLSQLMAGGPKRSGSKLSGDAADLARQLADLLEEAGLLPRPVAAAGDPAARGRV